MAEAEDVITDVARHATIYAAQLWRKHRKRDAGDAPVSIRDVAQRLDLLLAAVHGTGFAIRIAQPPAPATLLVKVFRRGEGPRVTVAIPATDGNSIWLPEHMPVAAPELAREWFRVSALQQATRARRQSHSWLAGLTGPLEQAIFTVLEAQAADAELVRLLPGMALPLRAFRAAALDARPAPSLFPPHRQPLEQLVRQLLMAEVREVTACDPAEMISRARALVREMQTTTPGKERHRQYLFRDLWTGELRPPPAAAGLVPAGAQDPDRPAGGTAPRSARLPRRPEVREAPEDEDDRQQGAWMIQTAQPHEQAEDAIGMQRPTDRDETSVAEEFADALSELPEARLVSTPGRPKEVLLSEAAPVPGARLSQTPGSPAESTLRYPEWDCRRGAYLDPGVTVHLLPPQEGPQAWVDKTLAEHRAMSDLVRRRFEMLRAQRVRLRKQLDGEEIDLQACVDAHADFRAGLPMAQALYQTSRAEKRDLAILLLIDISGSTDSWISANKRIIDVEREALLLVAIALQGLHAPYSIIAFSGEGPQYVSIRPVKSFDEAYGNDVEKRIAALEPEHYTRAGGALRHATALLMRQPARHRLLMILSDGKPNDVDVYEGRYGVEDMRQAVTEARLQGIQPFCLTIDRQAAGYLPAIFGAHHYALLPRPDLLPAVLLEWMKRLIVA